jgi:predicted ribosomally synthesized peptide with nif11-like leader
MSKEQARAFVQQMESDVGFRERIRDLADDEERVAVAAEAGFAFTLPELAQVLKELEVGLSAEELERVGRARGDLMERRDRYPVD